METGEVSAPKRRFKPLKRTNSRLFNQSKQSIIMAYSLRTRSASATETPTAPMRKAVVKKTPATPKKALAKKTSAAPKKSSSEVKEEESTVVAPTKAKAPVKAAVKKAVAPKRSAAAPAKKTATPVKKAPAVKAAAPKAKAPARKARASMVAPVVTIEEIDEELQTPSMPEVEPISHYKKEDEEEEDKVFELVEGQVVNTHIRFSDTEESETKEEMNLAVKEMSVHSDDFEALDDHEPEHFELYNSEESEVEVETCEPIEEVKKDMSPVISAHSAFEVCTSQEEPKTFNWNKTGSTYYNEPEAEVAEIVDMPLVSSVQVQRSPVVISNPFGFGFTATTEIEKNDDSAADALNILGDSAVNVSKPNPYSFNSNFQSVSSPLDKLCSLTSQTNPIAIARTFGHHNNSSSMMATSYLPTSPVAGMSKTSRSPSDNGEEREARSPSTIQSIIVDDKHEDFSAF